MGKNDASASEIPHSALKPLGFSAHDNTQSYNFLIEFRKLIIKEYSYSGHYFTLACSTCWPIQKSTISNHGT